jgi:basic amino acid/polyamine antiporter, APA family
VSAPKRELTLLDCFGLGINGIIGSGIFLLPATLFRRAGGASPLSWLIVGGLCVLVALCFAEAAGRTDRSGGPYRYACDAFGPHVGFGIGWITLISSMLGYAAVSRGFAEHAAPLLVREGGDLGPTRTAITIGLVLLLGAINVLGIKPGARTGDAMSVVKIVALVGFAAIGLFAVDWARMHAAPAPGPKEAPGLFAAAFAGLFACTGFEYVPVPAGETQNPQRAIGLAMVVSVIGATLLYVVIQVVLVGSSPNLATSATPLVDGARAVLGQGGGFAMALVALVSAFGFCSGSALVCPRYVESFAQDRFLPSLLAGRSARFNTPVAAIVLTAAIVIALGTTLDFTALADTSNIAVVVQYISTCASVLVQRRRQGPSPGFRIPFGPLIPVVAILGSAAFVLSVSHDELKLSAWLIGGGLVVGLITRRLRRVV